MNKYTYSFLKEIFKYNDDGSFSYVEKYSDHKKFNKIGSLMPSGYYQLQYKKRHFYAHRVAYSLIHKIDIGKTEYIDHIDGNKSNNTCVNLRLVSHSENHQNRKTHRNGQMPGIKIDRNKYVATRPKHYKGILFSSNKYIGRFDTIEEAIIAMDKSCYIK